MSWTNYGLTALLLVVQGAVGLFGSYFGYSVDGAPKGGDMLGAIGFMYHMLTFQIDDMPMAIGMIFIIMGLLTGYLILNMIRGGS